MSPNKQATCQVCKSALAQQQLQQPHDPQRYKSRSRKWMDG